ncbi:hypothetical protein EVAR_17388_1 [Eumeta japonica]|uniref:Uncharacterized protein n=1 Tax=Eumeta variegata TaxID=151549 RepID=A0A4C1VB76_EUMVA|nr:hypothetical protein EVAR_17388_1 [Eumeta japonica]
MNEVLDRACWKLRMLSMFRLLIEVSSRWTSSLLKYSIMTNTEYESPRREKNICRYRADPALYRFMSKSDIKLLFTKHPRISFVYRDANLNKPNGSSKTRVTSPVRLPPLRPRDAIKRRSTSPTYFRRESSVREFLAFAARGRGANRANERRARANYRRARLGARRLRLTAPRARASPTPPGEPRPSSSPVGKFQELSFFQNKFYLLPLALQPQTLLNAFLEQVTIKALNKTTEDTTTVEGARPQRGALVYPRPSRSNCKLGIERFPIRPAVPYCITSTILIAQSVRLQRGRDGHRSSGLHVPESREP